MTFEEFKTNVERWQEDRGIYAHSTPLAQAIKAAIGVCELADAVINGDRDALKDAIGNVMVCLVGVCKMSSFCIDFTNHGNTGADSSQKQVASIIACCMTDICSVVSSAWHPAMLIDPVCEAMYWLDTLANKNGLTLLECCESAWHKIKDRTGKMVEGGVFVKDGDDMKTLTAIPLSELIKKAGNKRRLSKIAGIQNLGSLSHESVLIDGVMYRPSISTADWARVNRELVGDL